MLAARSLFETRSVASTSVKAISEKAGITRELFYYYFDNKQTVIDAVVDDFVEDLVESVIVWNEFRESGDIRGALKACIEAFKRTLQDCRGPRPMFVVLDELRRRDEVQQRAIQEIVNMLSTYVVPEYAAHHKIEIEYVREMFCVLIFGLVGLIRMEPEISNERLTTIVEQTLRLDITDSTDCEPT
jgi:AcrR family transcriptional regulator